MKIRPALLLVSIALHTALWLAVSPVAFGQSSSQSSSTSSGTSAGGKSSIATLNTNGQTVVIFNGKQVYAGPTESAQVGCHTASINGVIYAAAFAGDKVLWENSPGAAQQLGGTNQQAILLPMIATPVLPKTGSSTASASSSGAAVSVRTIGNETVILYNGQETRVPAAQGGVTAKSRSIDGVGYAAVFGDDQVLWENVPGAAEKVR